jgi:hypothetical protein
VNRRSFIASVVAALSVGCAAKLEVAPPVEVEPPLVPVPVPVSIWAYKTGLIHDEPFDGTVAIYSHTSDEWSQCPLDEMGRGNFWVLPGIYTVQAGKVSKQWTVKPESAGWHQFINLVVE